MLSSSSLLGTHTRSSIVSRPLYLMPIVNDNYTIYIHLQTIYFLGVCASFCECQSIVEFLFEPIILSLQRPMWKPATKDFSHYLLDFRFLCLIDFKLFALQCVPSVTHNLQYSAPFAQASSG
eukprot:c34295_g1_i1 orf=558-923(-)